MQAIVSLFDEVHENLVRQVWDDLASHCGLAGIQVTPIPHFSWNIAEAYAYDQLEERLDIEARDLAPFIVRTSSLGIFSGPNPVLYLGLVKDRHLLEIHARLWDLTSRFASGISAHYKPDRWVPHITLAQSPLSVDEVTCAAGLLAFRTFDWRIRVDNLALIEQEEGRTGSCRRMMPFGGGA